MQICLIGVPERMRIEVVLAVSNGGHGIQLGRTLQVTVGYRRLGGRDADPVISSLVGPAGLLLHAERW